VRRLGDEGHPGSAKQTAAARFGQLVLARSLGSPTLVADRRSIPTDEVEDFRPELREAIERALRPTRFARGYEHVGTTAKRFAVH
jgi:hypothetical protein